MTLQVDRCPICGEGSLSAKVGSEHAEYKDHSLQVKVYFSECDACGSEQANARQMRDNKRAMTAFKKRVDGLLVGSEITALREKLGITQSTAAQIFGGGPVAFSKYENDDVMQSEAMDKLLRLAGEIPEAYASLARKAGLVTRKIVRELPKTETSFAWKEESHLTSEKFSGAHRISSNEFPTKSAAAYK